MYRLIDSHCHLPPPERLDEILKIINEAKAEGVVKLINVGTSISDSKNACETANIFDDVFATIGIYPHEDIDINIRNVGAHLENLLIKYEKIVGIGECGIDLSDRKNGRNLKDQLDLFETQVEIANKQNLPLMLHNRNGDEIIFKILEKYQIKGLKGVSHCFSSNWEAAKRLLDLNFFISFSANITYLSKKDLLEVVRKIPLNKLILETDSPYLAPQGHRGEKNYPKYVKIVAQKVAEVRKESFESICEFSFSNTCQLFNLKKTTP